MHYENKPSLIKRILTSSYFKIGLMIYTVFFLVATIFFSSQLYEKIRNEIKTYSTVNKLISLKIIRFLSLFDIFAISAIPQETVAIIKLSGIIHADSGSQGINVSNVSNALGELDNLHNLQAIVLSLDSPGGSGVESDLISYILRSAAIKHKVPIYSFVKEYAASGGYWIACAGEKIFATQNSIIGSIGVISASFGFQDLIQSLGIERRLYTSGKNKSLLDPFLSVKEENISKLHEMQKEIHDNFINYVKSRRGDRLKADDNLLFNGDVWSGNTAVKLGLIDGIVNIDEFLNQEFPKSSIKHLTGIKTNASTLLDKVFNNLSNKVEMYLLKAQSLRIIHI